MEIEVEFSDHRGVIGRTFQPARSLIHPAGRAGPRQHRAGENVVDAQAEVATEGGGTVIPPTETVFFLREQPERVAKPQIQQAPERGPLRFAAQHLAGPGGLLPGGGELARLIAAALRSNDPAALAPEVAAFRRRIGGLHYVRG